MNNWLDRTKYPFEPHWFETGSGRIHYVDEGQGQPLLMVHGTPTWSFLYRYLITHLSPYYRCIAPDHLGFGLSDKPVKAAYQPADHACNLRALIEQLELHDMVLMVHDFGGPIGLSYALEHPEQLKGLVLFNTWMWSLKGDPAVERASALLSGWFGKFLYLRLNFSARVLLKALMGDKTKLTRAIHQHYINPFAHPEERYAPWVLAQSLLGSSAWYEQLWQQRHKIQDMPALLLWGMRDQAFGERYLERWIALLHNAQTIRYSTAGHLVQEEEGARLGSVVADFMNSLV